MLSKIPSAGFLARLKRAQSKDELLLHNIIADTIAVFDGWSETSDRFVSARNLAARNVIMTDAFESNVIVDIR